MLFSLSNPQVNLKSISSDEFSTNNAISNLKIIADEPRPLGSKNHSIVKEKIIERIKSLGLEPRIQKTTAISQFPERNILAALVTNIYCRIEGSRTSDDAVLFVAHYDSVQNSAGASDNGSAVAVFLETIRVLKSKPKLNNDLIFLFTDAEEIGLLGARSFADELFSSQNIKLVANFDSRGSKGILNMFQTSSENARLINEYAAIYANKNANFLNSEIYNLLNNNSDLTVFLKKDTAALNFANIDGSNTYHNQTDTIENVNTGLLQAKGNQIIALADHFGSVEINELKSKENIIYFDFLGSGLITYSKIFACIITSAIGFLIALHIFSGYKDKNLKLTKLLTAIVYFIIIGASSSLIPVVVWLLLRLFQTYPGYSIQDDIYYSKIYIIGFSLLNFAIFIRLYSLAEQKLDFQKLQTIILLSFYALLIICIVVIPGASFILMWSLLACVILSLYLRTGTDHFSTNAGSIITLGVAAFCAFICLFNIPLIYQIFIALGLDNLYIFSLLLTSVFFFLTPQIKLFFSDSAAKISFAALAFSITFICIGVFNFGFNESLPKTNHLFYVLNSDLKKAVWVSADSQVDQWTEQFFKPPLARGSVDEFALLGYDNYLRSEASIADLEEGETEKTCDEVKGDVRTLCLDIITPNSGLKIMIPHAAALKVLSTEINGNRLIEHSDLTDNSEPYHWALEFWNASEEKISIRLKVKTEKPIKFRITEFHYGLPNLSDADTLRPPDMMPSNYSYSNMSLISRTLEY